MNKSHAYTLHLRWTGNRGEGTAAYQAYARDHEIQGTGKPVILGSSDPAFRGDPTRYNPEELFVSTLASCHMLWYLHLCSVAKIVVQDYEDQAEGIMLEEPSGKGYFQEVILRPQVRLSNPDRQAEALALHEQAHAYCFIANSVNFPVRVEPKILSSKPKKR